MVVFTSFYIGIMFYYSKKWSWKGKNCWYHCEWDFVSPWKNNWSFQKAAAKTCCKKVKVQNAKMIEAEWIKEGQRKGKGHSAECQSVQIFIKRVNSSHAVISDRLVSQSCSTNMSEASSADKMNQRVNSETGHPVPKDASPTSVFEVENKSTDLIQRVQLHSSHTCMSYIPHAKALSRSVHADTLLLHTMRTRSDN